MQMRVLVAYASRQGSTAEIAARIADRIRDTGIDTDCVAAGSGPLVSTYDAFVVGSAVYIGKWEKDARAFVEAHAEALATHPTWLFSSGPWAPSRHSRTERTRRSARSRPASSQR
jgi:menaquinone-dependent protoporphyrinogen oxidase